MRKFFHLVSFALILNAGTARAVEWIDVNPEDQKLIQEKKPEVLTKEPTYSHLDETIRLLMQTGRYERVFYQLTDQGQLSFQAKPLRFIRKISKQGVDSLSSEEFKTAIAIEENSRFDRKLIIRAGESLKHLYESFGYFNATIEVRFLKINENDYEVRFVVDEKKACIISEIQIVTDNTPLKDRLARITRKQLRKAITSSRLESMQSDLNEFLVDKHYFKSEVTPPKISYNSDRTQAKVEFSISDPMQYSFIFEGNKELGKSDVLRASKIDSYTRSSLDPVGEVAENIRQYYLGKGYPAVRIDRQIEESTKDFVRRAIIRIDEGPHVKIVEYSINGRISRPARFYKDFIEENSSDLIRSGYYNRADLEVGYKNLVTQLKNEGYLKARLQSSRIEYETDQSRAKLVVNIDEGPLTIVQSIQIEGNKDLAKEDILRWIRIHPNSPLRLSEFELGLRDLFHHYRESGYLEAKLLTPTQNIIDYNEKGTLAQVQLQIFEGPQVHLASIALEGNTFTKDRVILTELDLKIGQILTPTIMEEATERLTRLGIFNSVNIRTLESDSTISQRTLVVRIQERDPGTFRMGIGANNERDLTLVGTVGLSYNNLGGTARALSSRIKLSSNVAQVNYPEYEVLAGYLEPFLFNTRTRGRVNWTQSEVVESITTKVIDGTSTEVTTIKSNNKLDLLLERDLSRHLKFTWRAWSLDSVLTFYRGGGNREITQVAKVGPIFDLDYRDSPFLPTRGSYFRLGIDYSSPEIASSPQISFWKFDGIASHYLPLFQSSNWVFANSLRGGYITNPSTRPNSGAPASEAFILGGFSTVRGFTGTATGERIPRVNEMFFDRSTDVVINSFASYQLVKSELRFPIFGLLDGNLGGAVFYDGGAVQSPDFKKQGRGGEYDFKYSYRDSAGLGLRYNTPFGPVSLEWGYKLNRLPDEAPFQWHFSIGTF